MYNNIFAVVGRNNTGKTEILNNLFEEKPVDYYLPKILTEIKFNNKIFVNKYLPDYTDTNLPSCRKKSINTRFSLFYEYNLEDYYGGVRKAHFLYNRIIIKLKKFYNISEDFSDHQKIFEGGEGNRYFIYLIMKILTNIRENSLVLIDDFDEKLDYFYTKKLIEILYFLVLVHKSILVVSTKSPNILEDLQKDNIIVTSHRDLEINSPIYTYAPKEQTFGASSHEIERNLFLIDETKSYYYKFIKKEYKKFKSYEEFFSKFDMGLVAKSIYCVLENYEKKDENNGLF